MAKSVFLALVMACSAVALAGCSNSRVSALLAQEKQTFQSSMAAKIGATPTELARAMDPSAANEIRTAREISARVENRIGLSDDLEMQAHLQSIAEKLALPLDGIYGDVEVVLLEDREINAFTPGGGKILVKEGLLALCENESQTAAVLAHELAHIAMRHPRKLKQVSLMRRAGDRFVNAIIPESMKNGLTEKSLRNTGRATLNVFVRNQEYQADTVAIDMLARAGYDPDAMVKLQRNLQRQVRQMPRLVNIIYGNHPLSADRAAEAEKRVAKYYADVDGIVSTPTYDRLARKYIARRSQVLAQR